MVAAETVVPLTFHWYAGDDPPFVGMEVKVTEVPAQTGFAEGAIETLTASSGLTVKVTVLDVAGLPVTQGALDVSTQVMVFPLARALLVYVGLLVPTLVPFNFH